VCVYIYIYIYCQALRHSGEFLLAFDWFDWSQDDGNGPTTLQTPSAAAQGIDAQVLQYTFSMYAQNAEDHMHLRKLKA
jgi:hypothetical protein